MSDNTSAQQNSTELGHKVALDERFYNLTDEETNFFKQQTGIQDDGELKAHILQVQAEAYKVCGLGIAAKHLTMAEMNDLKTGSSLSLHSPLQFHKVSTGTQTLNQS